MAYNIIDITTILPDEYPYYFFDANVWIAALRSSTTSPDRSKQVYIDFFEAVVQMSGCNDKRAIKRMKNQPKIIVTSLLISEIVNTFMRKVAMQIYFGQDTPKKDFKKDYRIAQYAHYNTYLQSLVSDFAAFKEYIKLYDDNLNGIGIFDILNSLNDNVDYNDSYFYYHLNDFPEKVSIVTDDSDFNFQDIPIITANSKLIKRYNA